MARLPAKELTERELQIMHVFWRRGEITSQDVQDELTASGLDLAYTTVATLVRILVDKGHLQITHHERPFRYQATQPYEKVSGRLLTDLVERVFHGSRKQLLLRLMEDKPLPKKERAALEKLLQEIEP
jgi:predicted transcriptional regulator